MSKINFKFNFKRIYLSFNDTKKETTLEIILNDFIKNKINKREEIKKMKKKLFYVNIKSLIMVISSLLMN